MTSQLDRASQADKEPNLQGSSSLDSSPHNSVASYENEQGFSRPDRSQLPQSAMDEAQQPNAPSARSLIEGRGQSYNSRQRPGLLKWFYDLPISRKQLVIAGTSFVSVLGLVGVGAVLTFEGLREQLLQQARSEVALTEINYNIKINQMGFGFRGQADNTAIINAAKASTLTPALQNQVEKILQKEIKARKIEYATLVGKDMRIIVNANANRQGEIFNPNNLVKEVFSDPRQIKASAIVQWAELKKESSPLPKGFANQDALIRYTVTPVRDLNTGGIVGALVSGDIVNAKEPIVKGTLKAFGGGYSAVYSRRLSGEFSLATASNQGETGKAQPNVALPNTDLLAKAVAANGKPVTGRMEIEEQVYTIAAQALPNIFKEEASGPVPVPGRGEPVAILVRGTPQTELSALLQESLLAQLALGLVVLGINVGLAILIGRAISRPVEELQQTAQRFSTGDRQIRSEVFADDEVGQLAVTFNQMADSIETNLEVTRQQAEQAQQLSAITLRIRESLELESILNEATKDIRVALQTDRVVVYRLNKNWEGNIVTESVGSGWPVAKGVRIDDPCIKERQAEAYREGRVRAINNIYQEPELTNCYIQQLEQFEVKANLVAPLLVSGELFGLLIAHQCSGPRNWQQSEIDLFKQLATQVGIALEQANLLEQVEKSRQQTETIAQEQRQQKELLQRRMIELLMEVDPVAQGDLTIRAQVTPDEVGTIADSYNSIISSLRQTVQQVQTAAQAVSQTAQGNEATVQTLSQEALRQAEAITGALDQIQLMANSVQRVVLNAQQAELQAQAANQTVQAGDEAMNRTVAGISAVRETVAETAKKVKRLGESSQKISRVVSLIGTFANRTNLLSLNAAIEAARAGEEGRGFAVVAEEVRSLAQQSATATEEIEQLVEDIQAETNEVVAAMEAGTEQVVSGTQLVEETRQKLGQISIASTQISTLVAGISQAATAQAQTSASVSQTIQEVAAIADQTSEQSVGVADSFTQLLAVAQELQVGMAQFKVN